MPTVVVSFSLCCDTHVLSTYIVKIADVIASIEVNCSVMAVTV